MKITDVEVDRFGVWRQLAMPLRSTRLNVVYGPNEAGKTTLMRFIRGMLCGFTAEPFRSTIDGPDPDEFADAVPPLGGLLRVEHDGRSYEIRRHRDGANQDTLSVQCRSLPNDSLPAAERLAGLLGGVDAQLFGNVFAVGLTELQELSTLHDEDVARNIYGLSLGPDGRRLLEVITAADCARQQFFVENGRRGVLLRGIAREAELVRSLQKLGDVRGRHDELARRRDELEDRIDELKSRRAELRQQMQGFEIVQRVISPWRQLREAEAELARLPYAAPMPDWDWSRIERLDAEIASLRAEYAKARRDAVAAKQRAEAAPAPRAIATEPAEPDVMKLHALVAQRSWIAESAREAEAAETTAQARQTEFESRQRALGADWPLARLEKIDVGLPAYHRLAEAGRTFDAAQARRTELQKKYKAASEACHRRQTEFEDAIGRIPESSLKEALTETQRQLNAGGSNQIDQLRQRETECDQRIAHLQRELARLESRPDMPPWAPGFLLFLGVGGAVLSAVGFITGLTSNGIAGLILASIGLAGFFVARAFQQYSEGHLQDDIAEIRMRLRTHQAELRELRQIIGSTTPQTAVANPATEQAAARLVELKRLVHANRQLRRRRKRLAQMRQAVQTSQRDHDTARQAWCDTLRQTRLPETLDVAAALENWRRVAEVMDACRAADAATATARDARQRYEQLRQRIETAGRQLGRDREDYQRPLDVLIRWERELQQAPVPSQPAAIDDTELQKLHTESRRRRRMALQLKKKLGSARRKREMLLTQAGVGSREEFEQRRQAGRRRRELEELILLARAELASAQKDAPQLAIVENDLDAYEQHESRESRELLALELEELESELQTACEEFGRVKHELAELERDRTASRLRQELASHRDEMRQALTKWAAAEVAADAAAAVRNEWERDQQPRTLAAAADYLVQLTEGRFRRAWTPLGERQLLVEDDRGESFTVEQLSNGTREQLFLAIRLALIDDFAEKGIELPVVLDDVLVNFDQHRTAAAVQTLHEFAERGRQVLLFTCHMHLAQLCEDRGVEPIWLPGHHPLAHAHAGRVA